VALRPFVSIMFCLPVMVLEAKCLLISCTMGSVSMKGSSSPRHPFTHRL
jgi:hypothetical protein